MQLKSYSPLDKKDKLSALAVAVLCFLFVDFVLFANGMGLGFTAVYILLFVFTTAYLCQKKRKPSQTGIAYGALSVASSIPATFYNDSISQFLMPLVCALLYVLYCISYTDESAKFSSYKVAFSGARALFVNPFKAMPDVVGSVKSGQKKDKKSLSALFGVLVAVPVLCAVVPLLVKSDAAFEGLVSGALSKIGAYVGELVVVIILFPYCYSYLYSLRHKKDESKSAKSNRKTLSYAACTSFLSVIGATYLLYLFSQLAYFFSAFSYILPEGYKNTASEFARRGFYEMCVVCAINIAAVGIVSAFVGNKNGKLLKALCTFISAFSALLVIVAMQKMVMNVGVYGLSENRILVFVFMLMMLFVLVMFVLHIFAPKVPYMQAIIIFCSAILVVISYSNIDARIADYNIRAYSNHSIEQLDVDGIANLSDSAVPYLIKLVDDGNPDAQKALQNITGNNYSDELIVSPKSIQIKSSAGIKTFCYAHTVAANAIYDYYLSLDDVHARQFANRSFYGDYNNFYYDEETDSYYSYDEKAGAETQYKIDSQTGLYRKQ